MEIDESALTILRSIRDNHRFRTSEAIYMGERVFCKQTVEGVTDTKELQREVAGLQRFYDEAKAHGFPFRVPQLIAANDTTIITEFIEGETPLLSVDWIEDFFVESFVKMDKVFRSETSEASRYSRRNEDGLFIWEKLAKELRETGGDKELSQSLVERSIRYLEQHHQVLEARFMHADFTENNLLVRDGTVWLIDYESCRPDWPRWYDVVNFTFNRQMKYPEKSELMQTIFDQVLGRLGSDEITRLHIDFIKVVRGLSLVVEHMSKPDRYHATVDKLEDELRNRIINALEGII